MNNISGKTKICMVIGNPIQLSLSPKMHNTAFEVLGIDKEFVFVASQVRSEDLSDFVKGVRALGIRGVSVTMPHKQEVMKYLDKIDDEANKIGAVNTIVHDDGKLTGYNTDWIGAITALEKKTKLKEKIVAVIGAGGAARAIVYGLRKMGAVVKIFNRTSINAKKLAQEFGCEYGSLSAIEEAAKMDIIINATSVGMNEDKSPINKKLLNKNQIVFDIVYSPKETRLIKDAKEKGATIVYGYEMLLYQGVAQFELYTSMKAPVEVMRKALENDEN